MRICHGVIEFLVMPTMMHAWGLLGFDWESGTTLGSMSELATTRLVYLLASAQPGALDSMCMYVDYGVFRSTPPLKAGSGRARARSSLTTILAPHTYACEQMITFLHLS